MKSETDRTEILVGLFRLERLNYISESKQVKMSSMIVRWFFDDDDDDMLWVVTLMMLMLSAKLERENVGNPCKYRKTALKIANRNTRVLN